MPETPKDDTQPLCSECHHVQSKIPAITFTAEDMLLKDNKHNRPLYYTEYISSTCIERIQYFFKDEQVVTIFHLLPKGNKLKLLEARRPNEVGHTSDPNYCLFHRMVHHPTNKCFVLKDKVQALVDAGVLGLKSEQKKVTANMVTLKFDTMPKVTVPDGSFPIPKALLEINDP